MSNQVNEANVDDGPTATLPAKDEAKDAAAPEAKLLDHNYDGIQEFDNPLPGWWLFLFWAFIIVSPFWYYWLHLGIYPTVADEYAADVRRFQEEEAARALELGEVTDEGLLSLASAAPVMAEAKERFNATCATCHATDGGGGIGPNLTDDYSIHGQQPTKIYDTIFNGVPEKGMEAWGMKLAPTEIRKLAAYVHTLRGTTPANPKDPQGELITE